MESFVDDISIGLISALSEDDEEEEVNERFVREWVKKQIKEVMKKGAASSLSGKKARDMVHRSTG